MIYIPKRQDVVWVNFSPQAGHEQAGHRSALVISHDIFNKKTGLVFVCPMTNHPPRNKFHIPLDKSAKATGCIMTDQLKSLGYRARNLTFKERCPDIVFQTVLARIEPIIF